VRVKRQRDDLELAVNDLRHSESMRDGLSAMLVHDLRTPLTAILGSLETLQLSGPNDFQRELIEICTRSSNRLLNLVNDLLDVSKMESDRLQLSRGPVAVETVVRDALDQVLPYDGQKRVTAYGRTIEAEIHLAPDLPTLQADQDLLVRILINILGNAAKFAQSGARVLIEVTPLMQEEQAQSTTGVLFRIQDNGPGIAPEDQHRIFDKFGQVELRQTGRKLSTGLGLTFCKLAVEAHGGRIWVESAPGAGSTFWIELPNPNSE
jgi:signal transduction histidine kinase